MVVVLKPSIYSTIYRTSKPTVQVFIWVWNTFEWLCVKGCDDRTGGWDHQSIAQLDPVQAHRAFRNGRPIALIIALDSLLHFVYSVTSGNPRKQFLQTPRKSESFEIKHLTEWKWNFPHFITEMSDFVGFRLSWKLFFSSWMQNLVLRKHLTGKFIIFHRCG